MSNGILIDTNILIYAIDENAEFHQKSKDLVLSKSYEKFTTSKNLVEFLAVMTRGENPTLSPKETLQVIENYENILKVIYPTKTSFKILKQLVGNYNPKGLKIHDFEIASIGLSFGINQIATFNEKDFKNIKEINLFKF
ncbi:type II toxin-antitoxin system VapC family toxin [bacterium]|nr:type II toxin-antitoxin system VapC family toxin [bacterium]